MSRLIRMSAVAVSATLLLGAGGCPPQPVAAPAPAPQTSSTIASSPMTLFYDSFDSVKSEWQQGGGIWERKTLDGHLVQKSDDPKFLNALYYVQTPKVLDGTVETLVRISYVRPTTLDPNSPADQELIRSLRYTMGAGLIFRMKDPQNYYMFRLAGEEGVVLGRMVRGEWTDICNARVRDFLEGTRIGFRADNWYRLKVDMYGSALTAYINDEPVCRHTDPSQDIGQVGVVTFKAPADFDYFRVTNRQSELRSQ
ncbi:MAG TPA: hypothetical protein VFV49_10660 [Thermoanaerobaculia bacterium]|nr:hypothetical protein [Thermoanaerobaculia bacterium]